MFKSACRSIYLSIHVCVCIYLYVYACICVYKYYIRIDYDRCLKKSHPFAEAASNMLWVVLLTLMLVKLSCSETGHLKCFLIIYKLLGARCIAIHGYRALKRHLCVTTIISQTVYDKWKSGWCSSLCPLWITPVTKRGLEKGRMEEKSYSSQGGGEVSDVSGPCISLQ